MPAQQKKLSYLPPPVGGLNLLVPQTALRPNEALTLSNAIPLPDRISQRPGMAYHITSDFSNIVRALHPYTAVGGTATLWATTSSGIYNVTSSGAAPAATVALTEGKTIGAILSTGAQNYLTLVNGADNMQQYDGTTWTGTATVGGGAINTNTFSYVEVYRQRIYFIVKNTTRLVYLNANSVTGGGTNYDTAAIFRRGGYLLAMSTWTIDGGTGPDDHLCLLTSEGEIAVFAGNDPTSWTYKGTFYVGRPVGQRPFLKFGGDLLYLTEAGVYPLSKALLVATLDRSSAITNKVNPYYTSLAVSNRTAWSNSMVLDSKTPLLIVNVSTGTLLVMNTQTLAWATWSVGGTTLESFAFFNGTLYAGRDLRMVSFTDVGIDSAASNAPISLAIQYGLQATPRHMPYKILAARPDVTVPTSGTYRYRFIGGFKTTGIATSYTVIPLAASEYRNTRWFMAGDNYSEWKQPTFELSSDATGKSPVFWGMTVSYVEGTEAFNSAGPTS